MFLVSTAKLVKTGCRTGACGTAEQLLGTSSINVIDPLSNISLMASERSMCNAQKAFAKDPDIEMVE